MTLARDPELRALVIRQSLMAGITQMLAELDKPNTKNEAEGDSCEPFSLASSGLSASSVCLGGGNKASLSLVSERRVEW